ncbi:ribosome biogenesis GTP-binding protein YihA/YsxC [Granulosicoccus antarcticus]|uniref:Probable GTP-binding protein EngB n=1 Tax=Granulosicoccus antarcticus IMCC3135 TaxID=1192854 RepID=A0A2Z2NK61_9GAMM|nr:ribosome biogenesis GTP-binding protein YihA/YsxC [Granulosicoccus antarcticus]ASJ70268.1 putative GTP-binding protein EngB [Granulosicoccus antarcticus IMCC3135]
MNSVYFSAQFHSSASDPYYCPESTAEVAFAGRSNAGKSSAINTITRNGKLARTSKTPGRTQLINHFSLDEGKFLVDLPGYGYAKVSKDRQKEWQSAMTRYLISRSSLRGLVLVMDIRHPLTDSDWTLIELQQQGQASLHIILTKADKISKNQASSSLMGVQQALSDAGVDATLQDFSALKKQGVGDAHKVLDSWLYESSLSVE